MTSDEKQYTERDLVLARREGFERGAVALASRGAFEDVARTEAERRYPLPKVTRPRVVTRTDIVEIRIMDGVLQYRGAGCGWSVYRQVYWSPGMQDAMRDLLANPTEEVDA